MNERITQNTATLQEKFPGVYRDFFAVCQKVASASNSFLWTGEFAGFYDGLTMSQKLPIRSYVGFEQTFDSSVVVNRDYTTYDAEQAIFTLHQLDDRLLENIEQYLVSHFSEVKSFTGIRVHILTELPLGHSLGSNGAIAAALAILLTKTNDFDARFSCAKGILALSQAGHSSGVSAYMALCGDTSPVVFYKTGDNYTSKPIGELAKITGTPIWPIDFGLIYTGTQANAESVILANKQTVQELDDDGKALSHLLGESQKLDFRRTYIEMLNMTSGLMISALVDLFTMGSKNLILESFFNAMNQYQNLLHILHIANGSTDLLYSSIHSVANKQANDVGSGVKISGIGKGGALLFALPYGMHRSDIVDLIKRLRHETGRNIWLDYASWIDGVGGEPGRIEQDIANDFRSHFIERDSVTLTVLVQGKVQKQILTNENFSEYGKSVDLVLDKTTGKILIAGQSVTSKELPSQKATVAILSKLIMTRDFTLMNEQLPSSYGESRYDLHGKIVLPIIKQVKAITGRDLQLTVTGSLYDDYKLTLNPSNIVIAVVEQKI